MKYLKVLVEEFTNRHKLEPLECYADGYYLLIIDEEFEVRLKENFNHIFLYSELGSLPQEKESETVFVQEIMRYSSFRMLSNDCVISMNEDDKAVLFMRISIDNLNVQVFEQHIEEYINTLEEYWNFVNGIIARPSKLADARPSVLRP